MFGRFTTLKRERRSQALAAQQRLNRGEPRHRHAYLLWHRFFGVIPFEALIQLTLLGYGLKIVIALFDTPFVYAVIWFVRRGNKSREAL